MVAERVEVFTRSSKVGSPGLRWISDGTGSYEIEEVDGIDVGTSVVLHLKSECREYADDERIKGTNQTKMIRKFERKKTVILKRVFYFNKFTNLKKYFKISKNFNFSCNQKVQ